MKRGYGIILAAMTGALLVPAIFWMTGEAPPPASPWLGAIGFGFSWWGYSQRKNPPGGFKGALARLGMHMADELISHLRIIFIAGPLGVCGLLGGAAVGQLVSGGPGAAIAGSMVGCAVGIIAALVVIGKSAT